MEDLKKRIVSGWTFVRALYVGVGLLILVQASTSHQWFGLVFGGYFASMGLLGFGCASGACFGVNSATEPGKQNNTGIQNVEFEEIKQK